MRMFETKDPKTGGRSESRFNARIATLCYAVVVVNVLVIVNHSYFITGTPATLDWLISFGAGGLVGTGIQYGFNVLGNRNLPLMGAEDEPEPFEEKAGV